MIRIYWILIIVVLGSGCSNDKQDKTVNNQRGDVSTVKPDGLGDDTLGSSFEPKLNFPEEIMFVINYMDSIGLSTDSSRIKLLNRYAYPNLRKGRFYMENGVYFTNLWPDQITRTISATEMLKRESRNLLNEGKGFFFTQLDSTGRPLPESIDFACEYWVLNDTLKQDFNDVIRAITNMPYPFPVYGYQSDSGLIILTARVSNNGGVIERCVNTLSEHNEKK